MSLPIKISPCPITHAVVEIRFKTSVPTSAVFGLLYQYLAKDYPINKPSPLASIPAEARKANPTLALQPLHFLENDFLAIGIGEQNVSFNMKGEYPGWSIISERFKTAVKQVLDSKVIETPQRFALRYINFFPGDVFNNFTLSVSINDTVLNGPATFIQSVTQSGKYQMLLKAGKDMDVIRGGVKSKGCVVDIDAFISNFKIDQPIETLFTAFLEEAHSEEKKIFFSLLKPDFLKTLNPQYA